MQRIHEVPIHMGRTYFPSKDGNMTLTRSKDSKLISLVNFNANEPHGDHFKIMAWTTKLVPFKINQELNEGMNHYYATVKKNFDSMVEICFMGRNEYVMMIYFESQERSFQE